MSRELQSKWTRSCLKAQTSDEQSDGPRGLPARDLLHVDCVFEVLLLLTLNALRTASLCFHLARDQPAKKAEVPLVGDFCQGYMVINNARGM